MPAQQSAIDQLEITAKKQHWNRLGYTFSLISDAKFVRKTHGGEPRLYLYALFKRES